MFYVKEQISDTMEVGIAITDKNVYTKCPKCGCEHMVDIAEALADGDLFGTRVYCEKCSKEMRDNDE